MNGLGIICFYMLYLIIRGKPGLYPETDAFRGKSEIFRGNLNNIWGRAHNSGKDPILREIAISSRNRPLFKATQTSLIEGNTKYVPEFQNNYHSAPPSKIITSGVPELFNDDHFAPGSFTSAKTILRLKDRPIYGFVY